MAKQSRTPFAQRDAQEQVTSIEKHDKVLVVIAFITVMCIPVSLLGLLSASTVSAISFMLRLL